ncbi:MAG: hypothetical protein JW891_06725 [Candidatus Lokiarchaeota archaeon]|nr:hypothetical protein [Candidatus Lokiarchaeota archaeon]
MGYNLKEKCECSKDKEFFYGAKVNKKIKDAYLGLCYLEPNETNRKAGPGKGHEEILFLLNGKIIIVSDGKEIILNEGEVFFIPNGKKILLSNLNDEKSYFIISGGHTRHHSH